VLGDTPQRTTRRRRGEVRAARDAGQRRDAAQPHPRRARQGLRVLLSKPATAFSPFAVTPDELGDAWRTAGCTCASGAQRRRGGRHRRGPEMHFSFFDLIAHITRSRAFTAGTILGSGTVSNVDPPAASRASPSVAPETIDGKAPTPFLKVGRHRGASRCRRDGRDLFGASSSGWRRHDEAPQLLAQLGLVARALRPRPQGHPLRVRAVSLLVRTAASSTASPTRALNPSSRFRRWSGWRAAR
jgi:hypothetical protein